MATNSNTMWIAIAILIFMLIASLCSNGYLFYLLKKNNVPEVIEMTQRDTLIINDTILREHTRIKYILNTDTLVLYRHDSLIDTIRIAIPIEYKEVEYNIDEDTVKYNIDINYHGFKSDIDSIKISSEYKKYNIIPKEKKWKKYIGIGINAGVGGEYNIINRNIDIGPQIGIGIQFGWGYTF